MAAVCKFAVVMVMHKTFHPRAKRSEMPDCMTFSALLFLSIRKHNKKPPATGLLQLANYFLIGKNCCWRLWMASSEQSGRRRSGARKPPKFLFAKPPDHPKLHSTSNQIFFAIHHSNRQNLLPKPTTLHVCNSTQPIFQSIFSLGLVPRHPSPAAVASSKVATVSSIPIQALKPPTIRRRKS